MFKMFSLDTHRTITPLVCAIDDALLDGMLQLINVVNVVDLLLHFSPFFVVNWVQICALGWPEVW